MKIALIGDCIPFGVCSSYRLTKDNKIKGVVGLEFKTLNRISISNELQKKHEVIKFRSNARTTHIVENKKQLSTVEFILNNDLSDFDSIIIFMAEYDGRRCIKLNEEPGDINISDLHNCYGAYKIILDNLKEKYSDKIILFVSPPFIANTRTFNGLEFLEPIKKEIIKYGFNYISFYEFLLKENKNIGRLFPDLHHPSMDCQIIMTDYIINNIEKIYEIYGK